MSGLEAFLDTYGLAAACVLMLIKAFDSRQMEDYVAENAVAHTRARLEALTSELALPSAIAG